MERWQDGEHTDITDGRVEASFRNRLEVLIPLDLLGDPVSVTLQAISRYGEPEDPRFPLERADTTEPAKVTTVPRTFVTDPLNPDTDGDGVCDGVEAGFGSDPTDAQDTVWMVWLPVALRHDR